MNIQNCAMRIVLKCGSRTHIRDKLGLSELEWLNVEQRLLYNLNCLVWKSCDRKFKIVKKIIQYAFNN